jgi:hypothetical protein
VPAFRKVASFVLHVGLPKAANTTLHERLYLPHPGIAYLGGSQTYPVGPSKRRCLTPAIEAALTPMLWDHRQPFDPHAFAAALHAAGLDDPEASRPLLGAWEGLASSPALLESLRRASSAAEATSVLFVLRHPVAWLTSYYLQRMHGQYLQRSRSPSGRFYQDFGSWLTGQQHADGPFRYIDNLIASLALLGRDRIGVLRFEDFVRAPVPFAETICRFVGVDPAPAAALLADAHANQRISAAQLAHVRRRARNPITLLLHQRGWIAPDRAAWNRLADGPRAHVDLTPRQQQRILALSTPGLKRVEAAFGIDLTPYFEPLPGGSGSK